METAIKEGFVKTLQSHWERYELEEKVNNFLRATQENPYEIIQSKLSEVKRLKEELEKLQREHPDLLNNDQKLSLKLNRYKEKLDEMVIVENEEIREDEVGEKELREMEAEMKSIRSIISEGEKEEHVVDIIEEKNDELIEQQEIPPKSK